MNLVKRLIKEEEGQGMIEYVLIVAFISIIAIAAIVIVGGKVNKTWQNTGNALNKTVE